MSIAILSIPLGIVSIILFVIGINNSGSKNSKNKKNDDDTALIQIIASVVLFFVSLGIFDAKESTGGLYNPTSESRPAQRVEESRESKSDEQKSLEEYNKAVIAKVQSGENSKATQNQSTTNNQSTNQNSNVTEIEEVKVVEVDDKDLDKQRKLYQKWKLQIDSRVSSIETIWTALWNDSNEIDKLIKALEKEKSQLEELKVPEELLHKKILRESSARYEQWLDSKLKACQMKKSNQNQNEIIAEIAKGDGLKIRANVEISAVGRELGLKN